MLHKLIFHGVSSKNMNEPTKSTLFGLKKNPYFKSTCTCMRRTITDISSIRRHKGETMCHEREEGQRRRRGAGDRETRY